MLPLWAKIGIPVVTYIFGRGKTGQFTPFQPGHAVMAAQVICEQFGSLPNASAQEMAKAIAERAYTVDLDGQPKVFDWPPRWLADRSHKEVWKQLVTWCEVVRAQSAELGISPCEYLQDPMEPIPPIPPVDDGNGGVPTLPGLAPGPDTGGGGVTTPGGLMPGPDTQVNPDAMPLPPAVFPTPGQSYNVEAGDTLFGVITQAYGLPAGSQRLEAARRVSDHPKNRTGEVSIYYPTEAPQKDWFPNGIISFGTPYQIFYLPSVAELGEL